MDSVNSRSSDLSMPLSERTNDASGSHASSAEVDQDLRLWHTRGDLRRKQSSRNLSHKISSCDASATESLTGTDSICNAEPVSSPQTISQTNLSKVDDTYPSVQLLTSKALAIFTADDNSDLPPPHSRWPVSQLEPIIERRTRSEIQRRPSVPRIQSSPERKSGVVQPETSIHSVHLSRRRSSSHSYHSVKDEFRLRSFSLNDLNCLPRSDTKDALPGYRRQFSSSLSEDALRSVRLCPLFPCKPVRAPPYRSPTPPGLPSFGTKEAQEYRLGPVSTPSHLTTLLRRWLRRHRNADDGQHLGAADGPNPLLQTTVLLQSIATLKRVLGYSRIVNSPTEPHYLPRSPLPPGIRIAACPGALTQAEDGTLVRGRWTGRASAHGVGQRGLGVHPFARITGLHSIDEIVQEIDKACETADEENRTRQMLGTHQAELFSCGGLLQEAFNQGFPHEEHYLDVSQTFGSSSLYPTCLQRNEAGPRRIHDHENATGIVGNSVGQDEVSQHLSTEPTPSSGRYDNAAGFRSSVGHRDPCLPEQCPGNGEKTGMSCLDR